METTWQRKDERNVDLSSVGNAMKNPNAEEVSKDKFKEHTINHSNHYEHSDRSNEVNPDNTVPSRGKNAEGSFDYPQKGFLGEDGEEGSFEDLQKEVPR